MIAATPVLVLDTTIVTFVLSALLPFITSVATKATWPSWAKVGVNVIVSFTAAVINVGITATGTAIISKATLLQALLQFFTSTVAYGSMHKKLGLDDATIIFPNRKPKDQTNVLAEGQL